MLLVGKSKDAEGAEGKELILIISGKGDEQVYGVDDEGF